MPRSKSDPYICRFLRFFLLRRWCEEKTVYCRPIETDTKGECEVKRATEEAKRWPFWNIQPHNEWGQRRPTHAIDACQLNGIRSYLIFGRTFETHLFEIEIDTECRSFFRLQHYILLHIRTTGHTHTHSGPEPFYIYIRRKSMKLFSFCFRYTIKIEIAHHMSPSFLGIPRHEMPTRLGDAICLFVYRV